jgi:adenine-specific DNA-methyltransferase
MADERKYKGALRLDWINKDLSLYYEIDEKEGKGVRPVWVPRNDIRIAEPRILKFQKDYGDVTSDNMLIKGDNLLVLRSLVEMFKGRPNKERAKCVYVDPPYKSGNAFKYYDDNLKHSEWLTLMRDRLSVLRKLMRKDGVIFVQVDVEEVAYLRVLMDEIFGRNNFLSQIAYERSGVSGIGQGGSFLVNTHEYILAYATDKTTFVSGNLKNSIPLTKEVMKRYSYIFIDPGKRKLVDEFVAPATKESVKIYEHSGEVIETISLRDFEKRKTEILKNYTKNFLKIFRTTSVQEENSFQTEILSRCKPGLYSADYKVARGKREGENITAYYLNQGVFVWLSDSAELRDGSIVKTNKFSDFWTHSDIPKADLANEGGVEFRRSKKPENLISRIINISTKAEDLVLDSFAGSGTTGAVAHKMNRRWIMVEFGRHADELIIPRLKRVIAGKDQSGISKEVAWNGGGGFKYYQLGESVICEQDMNWKLKAEEMAEAVFLHFQYRPIEADWLKKENMFLGKHQAARYHYALSFASREVKTLTEDLYEKIIACLEKEKFKHLTIFTNVAVSMSPESIDDRVLVRKIPAAILREYNLL